MFDPGCTELDPFTYRECQRPHCGRVYRSDTECPAHGKKARAQDAIDSLLLERNLRLSVTGGTTDGATLSRLATLDARIARVRGFIARIEVSS